MFVNISSGPSPDVVLFPTNIFSRLNFSRTFLASSSTISCSFATSHRCSKRSFFKFTTFFRNDSYRLSSSPRAKRMARSQCFRFSRNEYVSFCLSSIVSLSSATSTTTSNKFSWWPYQCRRVRIFIRRSLNIRKQQQRFQGETVRVATDCPLV